MSVPYLDLDVTLLRNAWDRWRTSVARLSGLCRFVGSGDYRALRLQIQSGRYTPQGDGRAADCVVGFAFGRLGRAPNVRAGVSNEHLAGFARRHFPDLPAILQQEVADVYQRLAPGHPVLPIDRHQEAGRYLDTREVAEQARQLMAQRGWQVAVLLAHGHHVPRALRVCTRLGIRTVVPAGLQAIPFCPNSSQPWTRSARAWYRRECLVLLHYAWRGWL
jgi:hypothetical protein